MHIGYVLMRYFTKKDLWAQMKLRPEPLGSQGLFYEIIVL